MCGIVGYIDFENDLSNEYEILSKMNETQQHRGPDAGGMWFCKQAAIAHRRLAVVDVENGVQPMIRSIGEKKYIISYNGELYNTQELKSELEQRGHIFKTNSDTEVLLFAYIEWKEACLERLNGIYAFGVWDDYEHTLFLARDRFGVKPLFYAKRGSKLLFASEMKALLKHPSVDAVIDKDGIAEVFGLGPTRTPGFGVYKDVFEIEPGHFARYNIDGMQIRRYWEFVSSEHTDTLSMTAEKVKFLVSDSITRQLVSDVPLCTFLSGGLDSSAITAVAANWYTAENKGRIDTYSFDYKDNEKFFQSSNYQPDADHKWVERMKSELDTCHKILIADTNTITDALETAVLSRDLPGMADIDSSLYHYCSQVKKTHTVAL